ncbi:hypothetical protein HD553DRAFT_336507, partial [Filobasidium floriforme]|uniref:uncharacterized protein n=1 Tax=Filobasidium floriforme TaxID=5210 RepID=UPI001E8D14B1
MSSANTPTAFMDFTRNEVDTLFSLLIPTLPEPGRFVYSQAVLCDKGEKGFSEETLPSFYTIDLVTQRRIGAGINEIWEKELAGQVDALKAEAIGELVLESKCDRVSSPIALLLLMLERAYGCWILAVPEWKPVFKAILQDGVPNQTRGMEDDAPTTWLKWLRTVCRQELLIDAVFKSATIANHAGPRLLIGEKAPIATPPRKRRNPELEKLRHRAHHLKDKIGSMRRGRGPGVMSCTNRHTRGCAFPSMVSFLSSFRLLYPSFYCIAL